MVSVFVWILRASEISHTSVRCNGLSLGCFIQWVPHMLCCTKLVSNKRPSRIFSWSDHLYYINLLVILLRTLSTGMFFYCRLLLQWNYQSSTTPPRIYLPHLRERDYHRKHFFYSTLAQKAHRKKRLESTHPPEIQPRKFQRRQILSRDRLQTSSSGK